MRMDKNEKMRQAVRNFKLGNAEQNRQSRLNKLKYILNCVDNYNADLLEGEVKITIREMSGQLERKVDVK